MTTITGYYSDYSTLRSGRASSGATSISRRAKKRQQQQQQKKKPRVSQRQELTNVGNEKLAERSSPAFRGIPIEEETSDGNDTPHEPSSSPEAKPVVDAFRIFADEPRSLSALSHDSVSPDASTGSRSRPVPVDCDRSTDDGTADTADTRIQRQVETGRAFFFSIGRGSLSLSPNNLSVSVLFPARAPTFFIYY